MCIRDSAADALHNDDHSHVSARTELSLKIESCCRRASTASPLPSNNKKHHSAQPPSKSGATTEGGIVLGGTRKAVSYTHLRAHETPEHLVCRLLLEKKKKNYYECNYKK
eukprot:TRINITY_DN13883_c0_g1_i2.p1 TRINITY_DN13883_c0_g1~~TRINITY_DN13883_c0_g1_i2.p1  ORF type:complete len:110 (-),score=31.47 TRINITY_DN13883_c0_g1_i2:1-330(-)